MGMISEELQPVFQGIYPSVITTCSADGEPNTTLISQVFYVDPDHVALSYQFFGKTNRNIEQNPYAAVMVLHPESTASYHLDLHFLRRETEGDLFEQMDMQLTAIASMTGMEDVFKLRGADIYTVEKITQLDH